jgi:hypothetical protein
MDKISKFIKEKVDFEKLGLDRNNQDKTKKFLFHEDFPYIKGRKMGKGGFGRCFISQSIENEKVFRAVKELTADDEKEHHVVG